jgi:GDP-L-fucose synthase
MSFWDGKRVLVTGGAGFIGSHVVEELFRRGPRVRVTIADVASRKRKQNLGKLADEVRFVKGDLTTLPDCERACKGQDVVINIAARVAGVRFNSQHNATMFRENALIATNMIEAARRRAVERFVVVSTACVYPRHCTIPTPESEGFADSPDPANEGYGWAKRMAEYLGKAYSQEFGMKVAIARPYNAYGPRDHFESEDSHVIAALIRRIAGGEDPVLVWGDGKSTRAFLYVEDAARGLLDVAEKYAECDPVNLGTDEEVSIGELARTILRVSGSKAKLRFDVSKPSGQPRRNCDTRKAKEKVGWTAQVKLEEGLRKTLDWYKERLA